MVAMETSQTPLGRQWNSRCWRPLSVSARGACVGAREGLILRKRPVVLVVEDEFLVRIVAASLVQEAGFEAVQAANAEQAIAILEARDDIGVVFTDVNMPGSMDGLKLAAAVRDRWPSVEFIVTSGRQFVGADALPERSLFLMKPYSAFQVAQALAALTAV
jgi:two-component system, response regulator PdtaR